MERLTYDALGEECQHRRKSVIDLVGDGSPRNKGASPRRKKKAKNVVYSEEGNEENVPRNAEVLKQVDTTIAYEPDSLWRIGTIVVAKSKTFNKKLRGHIIMHIRGGITTHYAIQKVRVLFDQRQGDKTYEDIDVSTAEAAASALSTVDGVPRVAVRMWTSGTPCMRRDALDYAARIPDASDKERGFGVSAKLSKSSIKSGFAGNANQSRGLNKAEIKAQAALAAGRCTDASVLEALTELGDDWPQQDRPNVSLLQMLTHPTVVRTTAGLERWQARTRDDVRRGLRSRGHRHGSLQRIRQLSQPHQARHLMGQSQPSQRRLSLFEYSSQLLLRCQKAR